MDKKGYRRVMIPPKRLMHDTFLKALSVFLGCILCTQFTGCMTSMMRSHNDISTLDALNEKLLETPTPKVDEAAVRAEAPRLEKEEETLATFTAEKLGDKIKKGCLKIVNLDPDEQAAMDAFAKGVELFDSGQFTEAAKELWYAYFRWPDSPLQEDALYLRAEAFFFANQYASSRSMYETLLKKYPSTRYLDRVSPRLFAIARYWDLLDQQNNYVKIAPNMMDKQRPLTDTAGHAIKVYRLIAMHDPKGHWADHSLMAAANACYMRNMYTEAADLYDQLIKNYPNSPHLVQACELNLSAKLLMYPGPEYDGKALEDAEIMAERLISQFDSRLGIRKENIIRTQNEITEAKAERYLTLASYYETKRQYGAAAYYYIFTQRDFPNTESARYATERYEQIKHYRAEPKDYFSWLKKIFPED